MNKRAIILALFVYAIVTVHFGFSRDVFSAEKLQLWILSTNAFLLCLFIAYTVFASYKSQYTNKYSSIFMSLSDILICGYLCCSIMNQTFRDNLNFSLAFRWLAMGLGYILFRANIHKNSVLHGLMICGVVQAIITLGQASYLLESNHRMFDVTGSFGNPGQLGGFMAVTIIISLGLLVETIRQRKRTLAICISFGIVLQFVAFYLADSRAGIVGLTIGVIVIFSYYINQPLKKYRAVSIAVCTVAVIGIGVGLYCHRPASADARLLIWRVSADMIEDKPIAGHGVGAFNEKYMLYQAEYFNENPDSWFVMVADNVAYPYNELLHITIEQGIIGLLIILALFISVFAYKSKDSTQLTLKAGLVALFAYSMFSYPSYVFPLLFLFPVLLGSLDNKVIFTFKLPKWTLITASAILICVIGLSVSKLRFYKEASENVKQLFARNTDNSKAIEYVNNNFDILKYNPRFNNMYSVWLIEAEITPEIFDKISDLLPSCETYCDIGSIYAKVGEYDKAEQYYIMASYMIPTRLKPNYFLWDLYKETGDANKATQIANKILTQPLKVENTFTLKTKAEVREFLRNQ